jgi:hypothetical protein
VCLLSAYLNIADGWEKTFMDNGNIHHIGAVDVGKLWVQVTPAKISAYRCRYRYHPHLAHERSITVPKSFRPKLEIMSVFLRLIERYHEL